jgi:hypothetical protein
MADTLYNLINWLKKESRVFSWDVIASLSRDKVNYLLEQAYVASYAADTYLPSISEAVVVNNSLVYYMHDFVLDWPRLGFDESDLDESFAHLKMTVISGRKVSLRAIAGGWQVYSLETVTPFDGLVLSLSVNLEKADGLIDDSGNLALDLKYSDNFSIALEEGDDEDTRQALSDLFRHVFNGWEDEQRRFPLGSIERGDAPEYMWPRAFALRTQRDGAIGEGAVLIFVTLKENFTGKPPQEGADFIYLLPSDRPEFNAAVLVGHRRLMVLALVPLLEKLFLTAPVIKYNDQLLSALVVPDPYVEMEGQVAFIDGIGDLAWDLWLTINTEPGKRHEKVDENSDFVIKFGADKTSLTWDIDVDMQIDVVGGRRVSQISRAAPTTLKMRYSTQYVLEDDVPVRVALRPGSAEAVNIEDVNGALLKYFSDYYRYYGDSEADAHTHAGAVFLRCLNHIAAYAEKAVSFLNEYVDIDAPVTAWVDELIKLNFNELIVSGLTRGPHDVARFGHVAVHEDAPSISSERSIIASGDRETFTASAPVTWDVEPIWLDKRLGDISPDGVYTAPTADKFSSRLLRERIKATTATGAVAYTVVTVTQQNLLVAPLIRICSKEDKDIPLVASSSFGKVESLQWTAQRGLLNSSSGPKVTYNPPTLERGEAYVVDIIELSDPASANVTKSYLITTSAEALVIKVTVDENGNSAYLELMLDWDLCESDELDWILTAGPEGLAPVPGTMSATYSPAHDTTVEFALVEVTYTMWEAECGDGPSPKPEGIYRSFVILPLPLHRYTLDMQSTSVDI